MEPGCSWQKNIGPRRFKHGHPVDEDSRSGVTHSKN